MRTIDTLFGSNGAGVPRFTGGVRAVFAGVCRVIAGRARRLLFWQERARQRCELARLEDWQFRDIGITRAQASEEARKPFWRD